jgi:integrase
MAAPHGVVFGSPRAKKLRDRSNTSKDLRDVLDRLGYKWVASHTFRKTVGHAGMDEAGCSAREIAEQLGQAKPSMTQDVHMGRNVVSAAAAKILDR